MKKQIHPNIRAHVIRSTFRVLLLLGIYAIPFALAQRNDTKQSVAKPTTFIVVTNTNDSESGSLRDALAAANDGDTIDASGVSGTILLTSGELQINHNATINGSGAGSLTINGNATSRVFENFASTLGGPSDGDGVGGCGNPGETLGGGGIACIGGTLTLINRTISGNHADVAQDAGGGILNEGTLTVTNSTLSDNTAANPGGAIYNSNFSGRGTADIGDTVLNAGASGGTISNDGGTITSLGYNLASALASSTSRGLLQHQGRAQLRHRARNFHLIYSGLENIALESLIKVVSYSES